MVSNGCISACVECTHVAASSQESRKFDAMVVCKSAVLHPVYQPNRSPRSMFPFMIVFAFSNILFQKVNLQLCMNPLGEVAILRDVPVEYNGDWWPSNVVLSATTISAFLQQLLLHQQEPESPSLAWKISCAEVCRLDTSTKTFATRYAVNINGLKLIQLSG